MKQPGRSGKSQTGRFVVKWIVGVLVGTAMIGAGLYFGLGMMGSDSQPAQTVERSEPARAQRAAAVAAPAPAPVRQSPNQAPVLGPAGESAMQPPPQMNDEVLDVPRAPGQSIQAAVNEQRAAAQRQRGPAAPRPPTSGGIAAARLPTGEEILVPAGQRVDEYIAAKAKERGIVMDEEPNSPRVDTDAELISVDTELKEDDDPGDIDDQPIAPRAPN